MRLLRQTIIYPPYPAGLLAQLRSADWKIPTCKIVILLLGRHFLSSSLNNVKAILEGCGPDQQIVEQIPADAQTPVEPEGIAGVLEEYYTVFFENEDYVLYQYMGGKP